MKELNYIENYLNGILASGNQLVEKYKRGCLQLRSFQNKSMA